MECTKVNCPMQAGTPTDNCGENCPWRTTAKIGDLISRTAAIEAIKPLLYSGNCVSTLINMPAVDATPVVHGRWKEQYMYYACSVCGAEYNDEIVLLYEGDNNNGLFSGFEYCPHCGAKMDGKNSE